MDEQSDVDYMVVFADRTMRPRTYLDWLRAFTEARYARSEVALSNPTIVLELNHIRFELVPAIHGWPSSLKIPAKASSLNDWIDTDPTGFNQRLTLANQSTGNLMKPLVRVFKYWNACAGYPIESYILEQKIVGVSFGFYGLVQNRRLSDLFFQAVHVVDAGFLSPQWKQDAVSRLKELTNRAQIMMRLSQEDAAVGLLQKLMPLY